MDRPAPALRRPLTRSARAVAVVAALLLASTTPTIAVARSAAEPGAAFTRATELRGVLALADDDVWVVGIGQRALVRHWDGAAWSRPACPVGKPPTQRTFYSYDFVAGTGPDDVWLAGVRNTDYAHMVPLFSHWDGSTCTRVPVPTPAEKFFLTDIEAFAPDDVVVSGYTFGAHDGSLRTPLFLRWNGVRWSRLPQMDLGTGRGGTVEDIAGSSSTDLWASVAAYTSSQSSVGRVFHRVGETWTEVDPTADDDYEPVLASAGPGRVFAAGNERGVFSTRLWQPGSGWQSLPTADTTAQFLDDIDAASPTDVWAVGSSQYPGVASGPRAYRWDGSTWERADPPRPNPRDSQLYDVSVAPTSQVWAVGYVVADDGFLHAYVVRWADGVWQRVV